MKEKLFMGIDKQEMMFHSIILAVILLISIINIVHLKALDNQLEAMEEYNKKSIELWTESDNFTIERKNFLERYSDKEEDYIEKVG